MHLLCECSTAALRGGCTGKPLVAQTALHPHSRLMQTNSPPFVTPPLPAPRRGGGCDNTPPDSYHPHLASTSSSLSLSSFICAILRARDLWAAKRFFSRLKRWGATSSTWAQHKGVDKGEGCIAREKRHATAPAVHCKATGVCRSTFQCAPCTQGGSFAGPSGMGPGTL